MLGFLSDDSYTFEFRKARAHSFRATSTSRTSLTHRPITTRWRCSHAASTHSRVRSGRRTPRAVRLPGGHSSATKVKSIQQQLVDELKARGLERRVTYIPVWVTNENVRPNDHTQRTRSFLFACLGMLSPTCQGRTVSPSTRTASSASIPVAGDIVGGRATRTTHPRVLRGLEELFSTLLERPIQIENPLQWMTKRVVTMLVQEAGMADLLAITNSCTRPRTWTAAHKHCGACSQCIDRRFGILAAGLGEQEPATNYKIDLLTADRSTNDDLRMAVSYVSFFKKVVATPKERFVVDFPETSLPSARSPTSPRAKRQAESMISSSVRPRRSNPSSRQPEGARGGLVRNELPAGSLLSILLRTE